MKALVLVAHGSRREASNDEVKALGRLLASEVEMEFPVIEVGFLEITRPSIVDAINQVVSRGASEVFVVPYFLAAGSHVCKDIPAEVAKSRDLHKSIKMEITPHIGSATLMTRLIRNIVADATVAV